MRMSLRRLFVLVPQQGLHRAFAGDVVRVLRRREI